MPTQIFVNLPVKDLQKSIAFFEALGYSFNPQFSNELAACVVVSDTIYVMLLTEPFFLTFIDKRIHDAKAGTEVINAISLDSKEQIDEMFGKAIAAGGTAAKDPVDYGWMYSRSFQDPDGHQWEVVWMDPAGPPTA